MNLAIVHGEPVNLELVKLLDLLRPRFVHGRLATFFGWPVLSVQWQALIFERALVGNKPEEKQ